MVSTACEYKSLRYFSLVSSKNNNKYLQKTENSVQLQAEIIRFLRFTKDFYYKMLVNMSVTDFVLIRGLNLLLIFFMLVNPA